MKQIRYNVFETNSSSTHSIAIPLATPATIPSVIHFGFGDYNWNPEEVEDVASYLWTAICCNYKKSEINKFRKQIEIICREHGVVCTFAEPTFHHYTYEGKRYSYFEDGNIDHADMLADWIKQLVENPEKLIRYLSGGIIFIGNDNTLEDHIFAQRTRETYDDGNVISKIKQNPYYMKNWKDYEWFEKGN